MSEPPLHYLDHAASTPIRPEVLAVMAEVAEREYANPSGQHRLARAARRVLDTARADIAEVLGASPGEVIFTSGGTESDNLAIHGVGGDEPGAVLVTAAEHHAVLEPAEERDALVVACGSDGRIDLDDLDAHLSPATRLVSAMLVNNEIGTVNDLDAIKRRIRRRSPDAVLHTDAVQALPYLDLRPAAATAELVSIGGHKIGGPRGIGVLLVRNGVRLSPRQRGGGQERERRAGTPDVASAVGLALAARRTDEERDDHLRSLSTLAERLRGGIAAGIADAVFTASSAVPGIVHVCVPGLDSEELVLLLERRGVMVSAASSCASGAQQRSHVLAAIGIDPALARGAIRFSLGRTTSAADIDAAIGALCDAVARLRARADASAL